MRDVAPALDALRAARERTLAAGSARVIVRVEHHWDALSRRSRRRGGLLRPLARPAKVTLKRLWKFATRNFEVGVMEAEGVLDLTGRRYMVDYGSHAYLHADGQDWSGPPGYPLVALPPGMSFMPSALWLIDLLAGVTDASEDGAEAVHGAACRRLRAVVDLGRASRATPGGVAVPRMRHFEELLALPATVWIDDTHIRRVSFTESVQFRTDSVELWDFGTPVAELDWTRLPSYRSPKQRASERAR